jgi:hypothetical protein
MLRTLNDFDFFGWIYIATTILSGAMSAWAAIEWQLLRRRLVKLLDSLG